MTTPLTPVAGALILAAGKGTRMYSDTPKVLQQILQEPMLRYVYDAVMPLMAEYTQKAQAAPDAATNSAKQHIWTVIGHKAEMVQNTFPQYTNNFIIQEQQLGTGHALQVAWPTLEQAGLTHILVINGDTPLLPSYLLQDFYTACVTQHAAIGFMTLTLEDPAAFGRVVRKDNAVHTIVEAKDYDESLHGPEPKEINAGIYCLELNAIKPLLSKLNNNNKNGEFYITDLIALAVDQKLAVVGHNLGDNPYLLGINNPYELVRSEELIREQIVEKFQKDGVIIRAAHSVRIGPDVTIERGVSITGPCEIYGTCHIAAGAVIESHCVITNSDIGAGTKILSFCHIQQASVAQGCSVGPYARLRPLATLDDNVHIGNFVEVKKSHFAKGAKASHLSYIGDATIGEKVNIGAGTITCNYDGKNKFTTVIEEGAFIGSNSSLVAPVTIGKKALVGAGSVITKNVPENHLAVARGTQITRERRFK